MAWLPTKPAAGDKLKNSQSDIQNNFTEIDTSFSVNHEQIGSGADQGKHKFVTLTKQTSDPSKSGDELILFDKTATTAGFAAVRTLFIRKNSAGDRQFIPLTNGTSFTDNEISDVNSRNTGGFAFLGTGLCIKFGNVTLDFAKAGATASPLDNDSEGEYDIPIGSSYTGPDFKVSGTSLKVIYASAQLSYPGDSLPFGGTGTATAYIDFTESKVSGGNQILKVRVKNKSGGALQQFTRIYFFVIGQVDLENA